MRSTIGAHLRETGRQLVQDPERIKDPVDFVERLLAEKDKYDRQALPRLHWLSNDNSMQLCSQGFFMYANACLCSC